MDIPTIMRDLNKEMGYNKALLIVLDGFGIGKDSPFNAIQNAKMPFYRELLKKYPHSQLLTHGHAVGLPQGVMGNSEVGHMTLGAGRIIYQDLTRISQEIENKKFFSNPVFKTLLTRGSQENSTVHLMGLLSDGGVHSHIEHLEALLDLCLSLNVPRVSVHVFLDGRDTPPQSGITYLQRLLSHSAFQPHSKTKTQIASMSGRYYAMDRDQRWDRVHLAFKAITGESPEINATPLGALEKSYQNKKTDEFFEPVCFSHAGRIQSQDSILFFNYRSDRAREISRALTDAKFVEFKRPTLSGGLPTLSGMTQYDPKLSLPFAYGPQNLTHLFGEWLEKHNLSQFRIAETEKYAHVTFFFNGGREKPFNKEERFLVPSPKDVATYDLKPEMSAFGIAQEAKKRIELGQTDFTLINFANADMVGHTGNYEAAIQAMEALDQCLAQVIGAAEKSSTHVILTADHGNAEEMRDCNGGLHTQHTLNPVPALWIAPGSAIAPKKSRVAMNDGTLEDIMPTLCGLMGLPLPPEVTGKNLIQT